MKKAKAFKKGDNVAGAIVLDLIHEHPTKRSEDIYLVEYTCCGYQGEIFHDSLKRRERNAMLSKRELIPCIACQKQLSSNRCKERAKNIKGMQKERKPEINVSSLMELWKRPI